ncbi:tetratricopeptide repeat protein [Chryseobacterium sp. 7]|uniref:tetratricopeptide repeat protein n=1 Tax=Chryseobacterium sp. 7 TaxID=2035214 RepID=UPI000EAF1B4B|nr:tetratricopeptide repeat protein [Chryseobacterium sp. 7]RLJ31335.1 tetratricopeptide repeat protein [Chryseobacterium sp. 7]
MNAKSKQELIDRVKKLNEEENYEEVIKILSDEILEQINDYELYSEVAQSKCRLGRNDYELDGIKSINIKENAKANHYLGNFFIDSNPTLAEEYYKKAIKLDAHFVLAYQGLGILFQRLKQDNTAEEYYRKAISMDPNNPNISFAYIGLAEIYSDKEEYDEAEVYFKKAIKINPKDRSYAYNGIGNLYYAKEDLKNAIKYYNLSVKNDVCNSSPYYNTANIYFSQGKYVEAKNNYQRYIDLEKVKDFYYNNSISQIREISKILLSEDYEKIQKIVSKIQKTLEYEEDCITHFTSLSVAKALILEKSKFRLSEGAFLNDTSEGAALFEYLKYESPLSKKESHIDIIFVKKPFIGSFVSQNKHNDLTMWRMYGKEGKEEARGCAITMNKEVLIEEIKSELNINKTSTNERDFKFYRVAYKKENGQFFIPEQAEESIRNKNLNDYCNQLKLALEEFNKKTGSKDIQKDVEELLFEIAFLFKGIEYQYEHEVRLVQKGIGFDKKVDRDFEIPRVYIELSEILKSVKKITLGPKVERADEWGAALYYELQNNEIEAEIHISKQPFK